MPLLTYYLITAVKITVPLFVVCTQCIIAHHLPIQLYFTVYSHCSQYKDPTTNLHHCFLSFVKTLWQGGCFLSFSPTQSKNSRTTAVRQLIKSITLKHKFRLMD